MSHNQPRNHRDLDVWRKSLAFAKQVYIATAVFPKREIYGLSAQLRRAAVSVPSNISEGAARAGKKEYIHFLNVSRASLAEVETQLIIASDLGILENSDSLLHDLKDIEKMINALISSLRRPDWQ